MTVTVERIGPEAAAQLHAVVRGAFAARPPVDPPADALQESEDDIRSALEHGGGLLASLTTSDGPTDGAGSAVVGGLVFDPQGDTLWLRRVGVLPAVQAHGVAGRLLAEALWAAAGFAEIAVIARAEFPSNVAFWRHLGFVETHRRHPYVELRRPGTRAIEAPDAASMRAVGRQVASDLKAGDLLVLTGGLGAGKTTFTQGLGEGLGVRGEVTSPTFVISRVHPNLGLGPDLVHVDAYRLGGAVELDDLDLDTSLEHAVTVVEWGAGIAEDLAESRLEVRIERARGAAQPQSSDEVAEGEVLDPRQVLLAPVGPGWKDRMPCGAISAGDITSVCASRFRHRY